MNRQNLNVLPAILFLSSMTMAAQPRTTGAVKWVDPPPSDVSTGRLEDNKSIQLFAERQGVTLQQSITADITKAGSYASAASPRGVKPQPSAARQKPLLSKGSIPDGTIVDSYLLHFDPLATGGAGKPVTGNVAFSEKVLGILIMADSLRATHVLLGAPDTTYPTGDAGDPTFEGGTRIKLGDSQKLIALTLVPTKGAVNIRVITAAAKATKAAAAHPKPDGDSDAADRSSEGAGDAQALPKPKKKQRNKEESDRPPTGGILPAPSAWSGTRTLDNRSNMTNCQIKVERSGANYLLTFCEHHCQLKVAMLFTLDGNRLTLVDYKNQSVGDVTIENLTAQGSTNGEGIQIGYSWVQSGRGGALSGRRRGLYQRAVVSGSIDVTRDR